MNSPKVLLVTSEVFPFSKTGGLGDVAGSLAVYLPEKGIKVSVVSPLYRKTKEILYREHEIIETKEIRVKIPGRFHVPGRTSLKLLRVLFKGTEFIFVDHPCYDREGIYDENGKAYEDNLLRFSLLSRASIMAFLSGFTFTPEIIHLNDWQSTLTAFFLKRTHRELTKILGKTPYGILLTIHNFAYQGIFPPQLCWQSALPSNLCAEFLHNGNINLLKAGIENSDFVNTVSPTYRDETLSSDEYSFGLSQILKKKEERYLGILNGADYSRWNPSTDRLIPHRYDPTRNFKEAYQKKLKNKLEFLQRHFPHESTIEKPLISMVARATYEKGFDILIESLDEILKMPLDLFIVAKGNPEIEKRLSGVNSKNFRFHAVFDEKLAHQAIASSDIFLMPSRFEPCGLTQIYSMRYATAPLVHLTGGLADTVVPHPEEGSTGFGFKIYSSHALIQTIKEALEVHGNKDEFLKIIERASRQDFSWHKRIDDYVNLYNRILEEKPFLSGVVP